MGGGKLCPLSFERTADGDFGIRHAFDECQGHPVSLLGKRGQGWEDVLAVVLILQILFLLCPAVIVVSALILSWKRRQWTWKDVGRFLVEQKDRAADRFHSEKANGNTFRRVESSNKGIGVLWRRVYELEKMDGLCWNRVHGFDSGSLRGKDGGAAASSKEYVYKSEEVSIEGMEDSHQFQNFYIQGKGCILRQTSGWKKEARLLL